MPSDSRQGLLAKCFKANATLTQVDGDSSSLIVKFPRPMLLAAQLYVMMGLVWSSSVVVWVVLELYHSP